MEMKFCPQCGKKLVKDYLFCIECGTPLPSAFAGTSPDTDKDGQASDISTAVFSEPESFSEVPIPQTTDSPKTDGDTVFDVREPDVPSDGGDACTTASDKRDLPRPLGKRILTAIASTLLALLLFISATAAQAGLIARIAANESTVQAMLDSVNLSEIRIENIDIPGIELDGDEELYEVIYKSINEYYIETYGIKKEHIEDLLDSDTIKGFLGDKISESGDYFFGNGGDNQIVTAEEIINFIDENRKEIEKITGYAILPEDLNDIEEVLEDNLQDMTWDSVMGDSPIDVVTLRGVLSVYALIGILVAVVALSAVIIIINRRLSSALMYCGFALAVSGTLTVLASVVMNRLYEPIANLIGTRTAVVSNALSGVSNATLFCGLAVLGAGILTVAVAAVGRSVVNKRKQTKILTIEG